jgi:hypothetical protein
MPPAVTFELNEFDVARFQQAVTRNALKFSKTMKSSLAWGLGNICTSLAPLTPVSKKKRPVIQNPAWKSPADFKVGRYGVDKYYQRPPSPRFVPIRGRATVDGKIRFISRTTGRVLERDRTTGEVHRVDESAYRNEKDALDVKNHRHTKIGRSGLAKKTWQYLKIKTISGGVIFADGIPNMGEIKWEGSGVNSMVRLTNKVLYMSKIMQGGMGAITTALRKATNSMMYKINGEIKSELQRAA